MVDELIHECWTPAPPHTQTVLGLLGRRMAVNLRQRLLRVDTDAMLSGFVQHRPSSDFSAAWVGEHAGKFLDAACRALRSHDDDLLRARARDVATALMAAQGDDGYLGTYVPADRWTGWDVWVHKYNLLGLLAYHELSGDAAALAACCRIGDLLARTFGSGTGQGDINRAGWFFGMAATSVLEPLCALYCRTGTIAYLDLAGSMVRSYSEPNGVNLVDGVLAQGGIGGLASLKAYELLSNLVGLVDMYRLTGEARLLAAVVTAWDDIQQHQLYPTGSVSAMEHFQFDGRLRALPSANIAETCATVTWLQLCARLFRLTGLARYGAELERTVYNHLLAAQDASTGNFSYYTALCGAKEFTAFPLCCVSSGARGLSLLPDLIWGVADGALVVNLYNAARARLCVQGVEVDAVMHTRFPVDGAVLLELLPARPATFTVRLRVPVWTRRFRVVTEFGEHSGVPGEMLCIHQTWRPGSVLKITIDMSVRAAPLSPRHPDQLLVQRGPQVLSLDAATNPTLCCVHRAALDDGFERQPALQEVDAEEQIYSTPGFVGVPDDQGGLRAEPHELRLTPFADATRFTALLPRVSHLLRQLPAANLHARAFLSHIHLPPGISDAGPHGVEAFAEHVTDEDPISATVLDMLGLDLAAFGRGDVQASRGEAWIATALPAQTAIARVVFRHGELSASDGWFDTRAGKPRLELAETPVTVTTIDPTAHTAWRAVAVFDSYPDTAGYADIDTLTRLRVPFAVILDPPLQAHGLRIVGRPAGHLLSCAALSAYRLEASPFRPALPTRSPPRKPA